MLPDKPWTDGANSARQVEHQRRMSLEPPLHSIQQFFHEKIPLTRAMGVAVEAYDWEHLVLTAPLEPNHNHLGTAFGGSLSALAILAGYGFLWLELADPEYHVVVAGTSMSFRRAVRGILRATCRRPEDKACEVFKAKLAQKGKAGIELHVIIGEPDDVAVDFTGTFVAMK